MKAGIFKFDDGMLSSHLDIIGETFLGSLLMRLPFSESATYRQTNDNCWLASLASAWSWALSSRPLCLCMLRNRNSKRLLTSTINSHGTLA